GNHQQYAQMTHHNPQKHMVPAAVLIQSKPVSITAVRPVSATMPQIKGNPQHALKDKGFIDSGCSRHITGNMSYLSDFEELYGRYVTFGGNPKGGKIFGKGKIRTGKLDFDDVDFVKELKFNLFSVSQMCDKKNSVLFTDTECLVFSPDFKQPDESQVLLKVPRENNMYNVNFKNIVPSGDLTCLFAKAIIDESNLWHRRLGHINFKTINNFVIGNLVRGLPTKVFKNDNTCVACKKASNIEPLNTNGDAAFDGKKPKFDEKKPKSKVNVSPSSSAQSRKQDDKTKKEAKGKSHIESFIGYRYLSAVFEDCSNNRINKVNAELEDITYSDDEDDVGAEADFNNFETSITEELLQFKMQKVWILVDFSYGKGAVGTKWVFRNKKDERGIVVRNKARLVGQGHTQEEGIDYEEVFAPVARIEAIRLFLAYASFMGFMVYQMDVKSAFLYENIEEEVYVCQPPGFEDPDPPDKVYKVVKQKKDGIFISQDKYVAKILRKFGLTEGKPASTPIDTKKPLLKEPDGEDVDVHTYRSMIGSLMYLTSSRPDVMFAVNDVTRLQALVDKKKVVVTEATIREALYLDDAEGVDCLPNEEFFIELARMGYEKPSTKLTFYKAFFSSQWNLVRNVDSPTKFYMYPRFLQLMIRKQVGNLSTHTTKYTSPALTQKVFANMRRVGKGFFGVETPLFESMLVEQQVDEEGDADENVEEVNAGDAAKGDVSAAHGEVLTAVEEPSIPSPTPPTPPPQPSQDIPSTSQRVRTSQRVKTSDETVMGDVSNQERMIAKVDADADVVLKDVKDAADEAKEVAKDAKVDENVDIQGRQAESQAKIYKIDLDHANKVLSMQEDETEPVEVQEVVDVVTTAKIITEVVIAASETVTAASAIITTTEAQVPAATLTAAPARDVAAPSRRRKGVVIRDLQEESTTSIIIPAKTKSKDKGKGILAKEDPAVKKYQAMKKKPQTEAQARKNMMLYLKNVAGFKMDYFKGMSYDDIRPIFEAKFNSNVAFLLKTKEKIEEDENKALHKLNETPTERAAKRRKLDEDVNELKRHLQIVPNEDDDVYTEATPLARKIPVVDNQIIEMNNKPYYKIIRADDTHQLYIITFASTSLILLVERKYPLIRFTLNQMLNAIRLKVEEESEVSLELLRFIRQQHQEG
nr:ribonuclease H-like domain-containing protein [Tanacetum cinerariifolium]